MRRKKKNNGLMKKKSVRGKSRGKNRVRDISYELAGEDGKGEKRCGKCL